MLLARSPPTLACPASYINTLWLLHVRSTLCYQRAPCTLAAHSGLFLHTISDSACSGFSILLYVQAQLAPPYALLPFILYDICSLHLAYSPFRALLTHKLACSLPAPSATLLRCTEWLQTITPASNFGSAGFNTKLNRQQMPQCHWYFSGYEWRKIGSGFSWQERHYARKVE